MPKVNSPCRVFNPTGIRTVRLTLSFFRPLLLLIWEIFNHLPRCRRQHSQPGTSASILSCRCFALVGSPVMSSLHTSEPMFPSTEIHRCRRPESSRGEPNPRLLGYNPRQRDHARTPRAAEYTDDVSAPHTPGVSTKREVPVPSPGSGGECK